MASTGRCPARYRIIFKPTHAAAVVEVLAILLRTEKTYR